MTGAQISAIAFVLPRLSAYQGPTIPTSNLSRWPHIQGLPLADPRYMANDPVDMLLGAEICSDILEDGLRRGRPLAPIAQKTSLGWILSGGYGNATSGEQRSSSHCAVDHELSDLVRRFWGQERDAPAPATLTPDEEQCEDIFMKSHQRCASGRYVVRLPFRKPPVPLAGTRKPTERLLTVMKEYEDLQHMTLANATTRDQNRCYLPHYGIFRESSTSTKLRVVFNGSQRVPSNASLNAHLHIGANLLPALADILLRWRWHRCVLVSDIEKMYRQILVHPDDRDYQRILWRHDTTHQPSGRSVNWPQTKELSSLEEQSRCNKIATSTTSSPEPIASRKRLP
ncbi:uncharacterized protein [Anoplolepis gracilipes]|uniref:uncharacterized protein n=1 Tax=Anoplolepis gracilipes TaxID=354296 RepID=UPI003BA1A860